MITGGLKVGGLSSKQRKLYVREVKHQNRAQKQKFDDADWKNQPITFTSAAFDTVVTHHNDPLVTFIMINYCEVQHVLVDTRSAPDIMYFHCFESLGLDPALLQRAKLIAFLRANKDVFAWTSTDMLGIPTSVIKEEVEKLLQVGFVKRVDYYEWVANLVLVKKTNGKWRMCIDYTNLNQACHKDCYPMPSIDKLVEAASGNERLSLLDAYSGYHQVSMAPKDKEKTSFYIGRNLEVYVDDINVKSLKAEDHLADLDEIFNNLRKNKIRLNPAKCIFGVKFGKFLGFMVSRRGIELNPKKIKAIAEMEPPKLVKDIQRLIGKVVALHRFILKSANKCLPFFKIMRSVAQKDESSKQKKFEWNQECQAAFDELKSYLSSPPLLTKAMDGEILYLYLDISDEAISSMLRSAIRAQALVDFIVECTPCHSNPNPELSNWTLYVDEASSSKGSGAGALLIGPEGYRSEHALKFNFDATNNMAEYEALLLGLQLVLKLKVMAIKVYSDSQLVVNQVNSVCEIVDLVMTKYVALVVV
ncbi:hypothetical protein SLEP1_g22347 [Rubroshorea leprosula]|uniref:RNase H type-1 domain-containing protein n=1 Tax=Rubroshorea leprosula TaxID=152421 RepID=A0AAV5JE86_9ROSI|nr:hypothetical protein SLEP1_g22347 [Rubroshorea leprosula]